MLKIQTKRLSIQLLKDQHASLIQALRMNELVNYHQTRKLDGSLESAMNHIAQLNKMVAEKEAYKWVIQLNETKEFIGTFCYWNFSEDKKQAEIGYELLPAYWKQGYMSEITAPFINSGFDIFQLDKIHAYTSQANSSSIKLLQKFEFERNKKFKSSSGLIKFTLKRKIS